MSGLGRVDRWFAEFQRSGDPRALARLFDRVAPELARVASHLTLDAGQAEDLVQSTFLAALDKRGEYDPERPVLPWLLGILANRARVARRQAARPLVLSRVPVANLPDDPAEVAVQHETQQSLRDAVGKLESPYREVIAFHLFHGLSAAHIAEAMGRPAGTVRTQVARGMARLRKLPAP